MAARPRIERPLRRYALRRRLVVGRRSARASICRRRRRSASARRPADLAAESVTIASGSGAQAARLVHRGAARRRRRRADARRARQSACDAAPRASASTAEGFAVLLFDFQAHGESPGRASRSAGSKAWTPRRGRVCAPAPAERADRRDRLVARRRSRAARSCTAAGRCAGARSRSIQTSARRSPIASAWCSGRSSAPSRRGRRRGCSKLILPPFLGIASGGPAADRSTSRKVTAPAADDVAARVDDRTTIAETRAMFARAPEPKRSGRSRGPGTVDLEGYAPDEYRRRVVAFLAARVCAGPVRRQLSFPLHAPRYTRAASGD